MSSEKKFQGKTILDADHNDGVRQRSTTKYVGCSFRVKIVEPIEEGLDIEVFINTKHNEHEPGSKIDCYLLPVHQSAIDNCAEILRNLNNIQLALAYSKKCANILFQKALVHEQKTFWFFLDPKEASNLLYRLQKKERSCNEDDYRAVKLMVPKWIEKKKVIFYNPYNLCNEELKKQPFVLVMQMEEMLERAKSITLDLAWVIDLTFKTNH